MRSIRAWTDALAHLFFPHNCAACGTELSHRNLCICTRCQLQLPETGFAALAGNAVEKAFYGRLPLVAAGSAFYFHKNAKLQRLIHLLKYSGRIDVGLQLGRLMGLQLAEAARFNHIDTLIPLPLYPNKERKRGYNQATILCKGMAEILKLSVHENAIIRKRPTETQTKKGRGERWQNVQQSFEVQDHAYLENKNILLVDDVMTTGATLDACGQALRSVAGIGISVFTLAYASDI